jgi:hypothetical protein
MKLERKRTSKEKNDDTNSLEVPQVAFTMSRKQTVVLVKPLYENEEDRDLEGEDDDRDCNWCRNWLLLKTGT